MSTSTVFMIHGVGNRKPGAFNRAVDTLAGKIGVTAHPVYWGDLGAKDEWITRTVPDAPDEIRGPDEAPSPDVEALAQFLLATPGLAGTELRGDDSIPDEVLAAATNVVTSHAGGDEIRSEDDGNVDALRQALADNWAGMTWLPLVDDHELLRAVGVAVAAPIVDVTVTESEWLGGEDLRDEELRGIDIGRFVRRRLNELDRVVGAAINAAAGRLNTQLRTAYLPGITRALGDILVYQRHRATIHDRVRSVIDTVDHDLGRSAEHPVDVVAHSLGGVIAVDMATADDPLWIRRLMTFGSQPSFFHVCDPRGGLIDPYEGTSVTLPPSIGTWTNLWEPLDPLAFVTARIFHLHNGSAPVDGEIAHLASSGLWTHSEYWGLEDVVNKIRETLDVPT